jgi:hypothetical protein
MALEIPAYSNVSVLYVDIPYEKKLWSFPEADGV